MKYYGTGVISTPETRKGEEAKIAIITKLNEMGVLYDEKYSPDSKSPFYPYGSYSLCESRGRTPDGRTVLITEDSWKLSEILDSFIESNIGEYGSIIEHHYYVGFTA
jgi:hypothetical protein